VLIVLQDRFAPDRSLALANGAFRWPSLSEDRTFIRYPLSASASICRLWAGRSVIELTSVRWRFAHSRGNGLAGGTNVG